MIELAIYGLGGIATIALGALVFTWPRHKSASIWIFYIAVQAIVLGLFLYWQQAVWKELEHDLGTRVWQVISIQGHEGDKTVVWKHDWRDIFWMGSEGWLCGSIEEGGARGDIGRGVLLHTSDGGGSWDEVGKENLHSDAGTFSWGPHGTREYSWGESGPMNAVYFYRRALGGGNHRIEGWLVTSSGIYVSSDGGQTWTRSTPSPNDPNRYAFFANIANVEGFSEVYAVGWQGIAYWSSRTNIWKLQYGTYDYPINSIHLQGSENRSVFAVGRSGLDELGNTGSDSYGAIYRLNWPRDVKDPWWKKVPLPGIQFYVRQDLNDVLLTDPETVFVVGDRGMIIKGTQATLGNWRWAKLTSPTPEDLRGLANDPNTKTLWIVGDKGVVLRSPNLGVSWELSQVRDELGKLPNLRRIRFFGGGGWILGGGLVFKYAKP